MARSLEDVLSHGARDGMGLGCGGMYMVCMMDDRRNGYPWYIFEIRMIEFWENPRCMPLVYTAPNPTAFGISRSSPSRA